jgi:hypothetical protein
LKKFDMDTYTKRRIKELRGEKLYAAPSGDDVARYIERRIREIRESYNTEEDLDKSLLGCYTLRTMGDCND